jgi:hypothetical protein
MNTQTKTKTDNMRQIFKTMNPHDAQEIRVAFYKAVEGLQALAEALEIADAEQPNSPGPLLEEHYIAIEAIEAMKKSLLGRIV